MLNEYAITTKDNPFNPFDQFDQWFLYDVEKGYNTCSKLDRISKITDEMSQKEEHDEIERAIDRLIEIDPLNIYIKLERKAPKSQNEEAEEPED